jgi:tetratricopeptide (TPR) repeat protein
MSRTRRTRRTPKLWLGRRRRQVAGSLLLVAVGLTSARASEQDTADDALLLIAEPAGGTEQPAAEGPPPAAEVPSPAASEDPAELLAFANRAYDEGRHGEARDLYQRLLALGYGAAPVHYNLGNAHLRAGDQGRAIASYLRAQSLAPRDQDVNANLAFARGTTTDDLEPPATPALLRTLFFWHFGLSRAELVRALVVVDVLFFAALAAWFFRRRSEGLRWIAGALLLLLVVLAASTALRLLRPQRVAVVVAPEVEAFTGTSADSSVRFRLHAGTETRALEQREGWVRVRLPSGEQGWVAQEQVEVVAR